MLKSVVSFLGRYPSLKKIYHSVMWKKHKLSDFYNTYLVQIKN